MNRVIVTGGGGFVGKAIVKQLLREKIDCAVIGRNTYPDLEGIGVTCYQGDISDRSFMVKTLAGFDAVFHVAALAGIWGGWQEYYLTNVVGTENVIEGCYKNGVSVLIYTSTPSVVFDRKNIMGGDESLPYPDSFLCNYARSKVIAEKMVLSVDQNEINTCAIRPHLIWGPGDRHLIPRLVQRAKQGSLKIVGQGVNKVDISYIDNVANAHILAAKNLFSSKSASAKAYFIGQERPVELWGWINNLLTKLDIPPIEKKISLPIALAAGGILEIFYRALKISNEPKMTRFLAEQLAKSHYFSHFQAQQDLGYFPVISIEEGMERLIQWLKK